MTELKPGVAYNAVKGKAKSLILSNLNLLTCVLIVIALGFFKFSTMSFTASENPLATITDAMILYAMAIIVYLNLHWQFQRRATSGEAYIKAKKRYAQIMGSIDAAQGRGGLTAFCGAYPLEELEMYRKSLLEPVGLSYELFEGIPAAEGKETVKGYRDMSPKEINTLKLTKKQIKAVLAAVKAKPRNLSLDQLISGYEGKRSKQFLRPGKKRATIQDTASRMVRYLAFAFGVSWYTRKLALQFSWEGVAEFFSALAVIAFAAFSGAKGGTDAINENEVNRIHDQCETLTVYCERQKIKILQVQE